MRVLTGDHAGGIMARRLLPALLIIPIIFDWLQYKAQVLSLFGQPVGVALLVVANTFFLLCLVWLVARSVNRTDERRRTAEHQFETFFSLSPDMVAIAGYDGYFKQLSPSWEETLGWTREQLASKPYLDFVHPDDTSATLEAGRRLVAGDDIRLFQNRYRHKDESYRWIEWHAVPVPERQLTYNIARDITERKRAEEVLKERTAELEAINKELESFSYSVSHDLRAPLRAIDGYARMILKKEGDKFDKDTTRRFNDIRLNARMMGQLIDDLLAFSRLGKKHMSISKLGMDAVIMDVWKELQTVNPERDMKLTLNSMPSGYGDRTLIKRVYFNLISNAVKFTKLRGEAHIEAGGYTEGKEDVFYIKDNGVGFDMAYYDKLFGVFQRLHNPDDFEGTGVGLATIQRIIHRHDGRVWAEGKVDEGATFYFSLPRKG
jgi:PAS domain S-box-containing protein